MAARFYPPSFTPVRRARGPAGEVIYSVEGDSTPTSQQDEEARIATLAHALKKLGNPEDAAEFMRCLNPICTESVLTSPCQRVTLRLLTPTFLSIT